MKIASDNAYDQTYHEDIILFEQTLIVLYD